MVERLWNRIAAPVRGLHQAAYLLAILTLASQALALLRDRTFAHTFGAGHILDLYYAAFRVPDLVFALVSSLVSAYILIPRITGAREEETRQLLSETATFLIVGGGTICLVLAVFAPTLLFLIYPEFAASPYRDAFITLARLLLVQPIILGFSGVVTSVSQVHRRFVLFALSPVLYNLGIIVGTVFLFPRYGLPGIGIGVILGAILHVAIHVPVLMRARVFPHFAWPRLKTILPIIHDSIPRSLALGMSSATALALTSFAARLAPGSISVFTLAGNLEAVPLSLVGASYAVAAFPALSAARANNEHEEFNRILSGSARHIILWSMVFLGLIAVLRAHIVRVILGTGAFGWDATRLTAALLVIFSVGLVAQGLVLLFSRALYAVKQSWRPLLYQIAGFAITIALALGLFNLAGAAPDSLAAFSRMLRVGDVPNTLVLILALAATLGQIFLAIASLAALSSITPGLARSLWRPLLHGTIAAVIGGTAAYGVLYVGGGVLPLTTLASVLAQGFIAGMVGLAASALTLTLLQNEEWRDISAAIVRLPVARTFLAPSAPEDASQIST